MGVLYGLGKQSLADRLDSSVEEAEDIIQGLYKSFPKLREYVEIQGQYPLDHDGYINTILGDKLRLREYYDYLPKAKSDRERKNIIARIKRLGVNLPIQGGTSEIMTSGFMNNIRESIKEGWKQPLQPIITVHCTEWCTLNLFNCWDNLLRPFVLVDLVTTVKIKWIELISSKLSIK